MEDPIRHILSNLLNDFNWGELNDSSRPEVINSKKETPGNYSQDPLRWPGNLFHLLGEYKTESASQEGVILLYDDETEKFSEACHQSFSSLYKLPASEVREMVRDIILWHQTGHWIVHWLKGTDNSRWTNRSYKIDDNTLDLHEGLAQIFVEYAIHNIENHLSRTQYNMLFNYLLTNQAPCFHTHTMIRNHKNFSMKGLLRSIMIVRILSEPEEVNLEYLLSNFPSIVL
jgi:hypothetical protein